MRWLFLSLVLLLLAGCAGDASPPSASPNEPVSATPDAAAAPAAPHPHVRAVTLDAVERPSDATLRRIKNLGATHLALVSFGFQRSTDASQIRMHTEGGWYSESDAGIRALARRADALGMDLILKPHVWVGHDGQSRQDISFDEEADWQRWQWQYRRFLLHYARLAEDVGANVLVVGTELGGTTGARERFWRNLIRDVRAVYSGTLTYAANWHEEYAAVPFWDALDWVGVQGYFPLSDTDDPTLKALCEGWQPPLEALRRVAARTGRPVFFTELGYRSAKGAAENPWHWPNAGDSPDFSLQARLYEAFFQEVWPKAWVTGAALWKWPTDAERPRAVGFTPQGKPAAEAIRRGFMETATLQE